MYHFIVKRLVLDSFRRLSAGDYRAATGLMSPTCHYHFVGRHALGGERHSRALIALWFERFLRVLPGFQFEPVQVLVNGWPWRTDVAVRLRVSWQKPDGAVYRNDALQMVRIEWFKAVRILTIDDTQAFGELLTEVSQRFGVKEAAASPIV